jgi:hypothetical protein
VLLRAATRGRAGNPDTLPDHRVRRPERQRGHLVDYRLAASDTIVTDGVIRTIPLETGRGLEVMSRGDYHARFPEDANTAQGRCVLRYSGGAYRCEAPTCPNTPGQVCKSVQDEQNRYCACAPS